YGVPDSLDGRFELIALHTFLILHRLKTADDAEAGALGQALVDGLFADMDASLREMGAGDLGVGPKVKQMAQAFYGRIAAYEAGLDTRGPALAAALRRNLYGTAAPSPVQLDAMADYVRACAGSLAGQTAGRLRQGEVSFATPAAAPDGVLAPVPAPR
ncbi:MAG: ubiquinol-cytochrome C chaperone family protein, partial [Dongiaceae bacterium]